MFRRWSLLQQNKYYYSHDDDILPSIMYYWLLLARPKAESERGRKAERGSLSSWSTNWYNTSLWPQAKGTGNRWTTSLWPFNGQREVVHKFRTHHADRNHHFTTNIFHQNCLHRKRLATTSTNVVTDADISEIIHRAEKRVFLFAEQKNASSAHPLMECLPLLTKIGVWY